MSYFGRAWLLCKDGTCISVLNHPSRDFEFDSIVDVVSQYGSDLEKQVAETYRRSPSDELKEKLLLIYDNNWCKIRCWGTFSEEVTFRITSHDKSDWYRPIVDFLFSNPFLERSKIIVESDKGTGNRVIYWDKVDYSYATDPANERILANKLITVNRKIY